MIIYGTDLCKDCVQCKADLDRAGIGYEFRNISENLLYLKEFLAIRDNDRHFDQVKAQGFIGIPTLMTEDGKVILDWNCYL